MADAYVVPAGCYAGKTLQELLAEDPTYIAKCVQTALTVESLQFLLPTLPKLTPTHQPTSSATTSTHSAEPKAEPLVDISPPPEQFSIASLDPYFKHQQQCNYHGWALCASHGWGAAKNNEP